MLSIFINPYLIVLSVSMFFISIGAILISSAYEKRILTTIFFIMFLIDVIYIIGSALYQESILTTIVSLL